MYLGFTTMIKCYEHNPRIGQLNFLIWNSDVPNQFREDDFRWQHTLQYKNLIITTVDMKYEVKHHIFKRGTRMFHLTLIDDYFTIRYAGQKTLCIWISNFYHGEDFEWSIAQFTIIKSGVRRQWLPKPWEVSILVRKKIVDHDVTKLWRSSIIIINFVPVNIVQKIGCTDLKKTSAMVDNVWKTLCNLPLETYLKRMKNVSYKLACRLLHGSSVALADEISSTFFDNEILPLLWNHCVAADFFCVVHKFVGFNPFSSTDSL